MLNKKDMKLVLVFLSILFLLSACRINRNIDDVYKRKITSLDKNSDINSILYSLDFPKKYKYKSMDLDSSENINELILYFSLNEKGSIDVDNFKYDSAVIFALIDDLDEISFYIADGDTTTVETVTRERIDSMTLEELNKTTRDLGKDRESFSNLLELYKNLKG